MEKHLIQTLVSLTEKLPTVDISSIHFSQQPLSLQLFEVSLDSRGMKDVAFNVESGHASWYCYSFVHHN